MIVDTERAVDVDDCMARMLDRDADYRYSVAWIDCLAHGAHLGRSVLTRGNHATLDELPSAKRAGARPSRRGPTSARPAGCRTGCSIRSRSARSTSCGSARRRANDATKCRAITAFFHPLDVVLDWNRIYGSKGSCSTSSSCRTAQRPSCARCSNASARTGARRSSRCSSDSSTTAAVSSASRPRGGRSRSTCRAGATAHGAARRPRRPRGRGGRSRLPVEGLTPARRARAGDVPPARPLARGAVTPRPGHGLRSDMDRRLDLTGRGNGRGMKDVVGAVQWVLVLGGGSGSRLCHRTNQLVGRRGARTIVLAGREPERFEARAPRSCPRRGRAARVESVAFDATHFVSHQGFVETTCSSASAISISS